MAVELPQGLQVWVVHLDGKDACIIERSNSAKLVLEVCDKIRDSKPVEKKKKE